MQAAGRIDEDDIHGAGLGGLERVEQDGARVGTLLLADDVDAVALGPDLQLLDRRGAEGVGGAEQHAFAFGPVAGGEFTDGGGFARAIHAHDQHDGGRRGRFHDGPFGGFEHAEQMLADEVLDFAGIAHQLAVHPLADVFEDFGDGADADVSGDERILQFVKQIAVDLLAAFERIFNFVDETGTRLRDSGFQTV